ncbi:hypothetical protein FRB99_007726 [Tulasnella sp. 403]|nr:hypothetical protein FRB99_007726 [Tulasnella sp. 403]
MNSNVNRIAQMLGLEIVMLTGLLSFQEAISGQPSDNAGGDPAALSNAKSSSSSPGGVSPSGGPVPQLPPKDAGMKVAGLQIREKSAPNEVIVSSMFEIEEYAEYACGLLQDDKMLYIVVRSKTAAEVPKVVAIASMVKRMRYKGGAHDEELHQYAKYEEEEAKKGPRVIKLDQPAKDPYRPPAALSIHLSKIPMPELQPRARPVERTVSNAPSRSSLHVPEPSSKRSGRSRSQEPRRDGEANLSSSGDRRTILSKNKPPKDSGTNKPPPKDSSFTPGALQSQGHHPRPPPRPHVQAPDQPSSSQPLSPRSSFWGFYNPGSVASPKTPTPPPPQHHQHHHRASSPPHGKPPKPSRQPSGGSNPTDNMPGHFPSAGGAAAKPPAPPPPPPQGMSSLLGGILPNSSSSSSSTQGGGTSNSLGTTASLMGSLGMHMYDRLTKRQ